MNKTITLVSIFISLLYFNIATAQVTDTVSLQWELLPGIPNQTLAFAKSGNRHFAVNGRFASNAKLYYSDDDGDNWVEHPDFGEGVDDVMSNDSFLLVFSHKITLYNQGYTVVYDYYIHRSVDDGVNFSEVFHTTYTISQPSSGGFGSIAGQYLTDSICTMGIRTFGSLNTIGWKNFYSADAGLTWHISNGYGQYTLFEGGKWRTAAVGIVCESNTPDFENSECKATGANTVGGNTLVGADRRDGLWFLLSSNGIFYTSADDGDTWQSDDLKPEFGNPTGFKFHNGHYYMTCEKGLFRAAENLPTDWEPVFDNPDAHLANCANFTSFGDEFFLDAFATGVQRSTDAGLTWAEQNNGLSRQHTEKVYRANGGIWASKYLDYSQLTAFYSLQTDGTWRPVNGNGLKHKHLSGFVYENGGATWVQHYDYPNHGLLKSIDGGQNWQEVTLPVAMNSYLRGATLDADGRLWFWVENSAVYSTDNGLNWHETTWPGTIYSNTQNRLVAKGSNVIVTMNDGLSYSTDLGQNWQKMTLSYTENAYHIFQLTGDSLAYFNGDTGESWVSGDFGNTWEVQGNGFGSLPFSIPIFWSKYGTNILTMTPGGLFVTKDYGKTWTWVDNTPGIGRAMVFEDQIYFSDFSYGGTWRTEAASLVTQEPSDSKEEKPKVERLDLSVFPNPTSDNFTIEMNLPEAMALTIEAVDRLGRRVAVISENEVFQRGKQRVRVDARDWPSGVYLLELRTGSQAFFEKIIRQ